MRLSALVAAFALVAGLLISPSAAQNTLPNDVLNPAPDVNDPGGRPDIPDRIQDIVLPQVQFLFDSMLDPNRISQIEFITADNIDDPRLTEAARSIIRNHLIAMQQVEIAIQFLQANRDEIFNGQNDQFNQIFGNIGIERTFAILNPTPIAGEADSNAGNPFQLDFDGDTQPNLGGQVKPGDIVFVEAPPTAGVTNTALVGSGTLTGFIGRAEMIVSPEVQPGQQGGGGGGGGAQEDQELHLDMNFGGTIPVAVQAARVYKVIRFEKRRDTSRYDRVLQTYMAIRQALQGLDPNLAAGGGLQSTLQRAITYNREFTDINQIWAPGVAEFTPLNQIVSDFMTNNHPSGQTSTRGADRLVRQAGFSNSDSHLHLDRLADQSNLQDSDYQNRPTFPLLWTEDNELPLRFTDNNQINGTDDEDRAFFRDRQTIFGRPNDPWQQFIGRAFLEESINHPGEFFDTDVAVDANSLAQRTRRSRRPERGALFDIDGDGDTDGADREVRDVPESGVAEVSQTELRKWQMIIESFSEWSTNVEDFNVAAVGINDLFGGLAPGDFAAKDGGNFARFAGLLGGSSLGSINFSRIEPFGKRGKGGFFPIVAPF